MYVITDKKNVAICVSETLEHQSNGNPLVHGGTLAIAKILVEHEYADVAHVPEDYTDGKYCYDGASWTANPDYTEPQPSAEERLTQLENAVDELIISALEG